MKLLNEELFEWFKLHNFYNDMVDRNVENIRASKQLYRTVMTEYWSQTSNLVIRIKSRKCLSFDTYATHDEMWDEYYEHTYMVYRQRQDGFYDKVLVTHYEHVLMNFLEGVSLSKKHRRKGE